MPADRAFGRVEKKLRRIETILLPSEYLDEYAKVGRVYIHGQDWQAYDFKDAIEKTVKRPLPFKITETKRIKVDSSSTDGNVTACKFYSAQGEKHSILKRGQKWPSVKPMLLRLESCVKPAKQKDVKKLLLAIGIDIENYIPAATYGPLTYLETIKAFYAPICISDAMDVDSDEEDDEATVAIYDK